MKLTNWYQENRLTAVTMLAAAVVLGFVMVGQVVVSAQNQPSADPWNSWRFLLGQWENAPDSSGALGGSTFTLELQKRILVRKNFAKYPRTKDRPAINHEDLLVLFQQPGNPVEANYWDNEGHYIHYLGQVSNDQDTLSLTSDVSPNSPRFRLSYVKLGIDSLQVAFELAPVGKPDSFQPYLKGLLHKK